MVWYRLQRFFSQFYVHVTYITNMTLSTEGLISIPTPGFITLCLPMFLIFPYAIQIHLFNTLHNFLYSSEKSLKAPCVILNNWL